LGGSVGMGGVTDIGGKVDAGGSGGFYANASAGSSGNFEGTAIVGGSGGSRSVTPAVGHWTTADCTVSFTVSSAGTALNHGIKLMTVKVPEGFKTCDGICANYDVTFLTETTARVSPSGAIANYDATCTAVATGPTLEQMRSSCFAYCQVGQSTSCLETVGEITKCIDYCNSLASTKCGAEYIKGTDCLTRNGYCSGTAMTSCMSYMDQYKACLSVDAGA
jgi:hypothetical protein